MVVEYKEILQVLISAFLAGVIGFEREKYQKPAGLRTHMLVGLAACIFTFISFKYFPGSDPARVAANILVGMGFIGAGVILKSEERIIGITTAATLWLTTAIGMLVGVEDYFTAIITTLLVILILRIKPIEETIRG